MIKRIEFIVHNFGLTSSKFADEIGVQRSGISHILSGRNNPSLDLIQKILNRWPEINPDWLITGKGNFGRASEKVIPEINPETFIKSIVNQKSKPEIIVSKTISQVIVFYSDGTFDRYQNP